MTTHNHLPDDGQLIRPDTAMLHPSPTNPRKHFDPDALAELAESIKAQGIMQPILARVMPEHISAQLGRPPAVLEIVAGERRWRAAQLAGLQDVPVILRDLTDDQVERLQIIENLQRAGLSAIEEAEGYGKLADKGMTAQQIAEQVGKSKSYIHGKLKLRALCPQVAQAAHRGEIVEAVALEIARIPIEAMQLDALRAVTARDEYTSEPMSYRVAKAHIRNAYTKNLAKAPFDTADATLQPGAGSCADCPHRLGNQPDTEPASANVCTDTHCYDLKRAEHNVRASGAPAGTPRVDIPRANPNFSANYEDFERAGYRVVGNTNHFEPQRRTYRQWLADHGKTVPLAIYTCPLTGNAIIVARIADLAAAADRIASRQAEQDEQQRLDVATEQPDPAPAATTAPTATAPKPQQPKPTPEKITPSATTAPSTDRIDALRKACRSHPPLVIAWPLPRLIAKFMASKVNHGHIPDDATEGDCLAAITCYLTDDARAKGEAALIELAKALNIDPATIGDHPQQPHTTMPYRHPHNTALTWSGKGRKPQWVTDWIKDGGTIQQLQPAEAGG